MATPEGSDSIPRSQQEQAEQVEAGPRALRRQRRGERQAETTENEGEFNRPPSPPTEAELRAEEQEVSPRRREERFDGYCENRNL